MLKLYLTGYEGENLEDFLKRIKKFKVKAVIDVREIPLSRKNSFSKNNLKKILNKRDVRYYHFPGLGSPKKMREKLHSTDDYLTFFKGYRNYINKKESSLNKLVEIIMKEKIVVLLCYEKRYELCHRSIVTDKIITLKPQIAATPI